MSLNSEAGASLLFYTGANYAGTSKSVVHGVTGTLATGNDSWTYKSVAMSAMHAFCWSEVNTADASVNYQNHTESLVSASITDLTALYSATAFPLYYLGIDPTVATAVWLDMSAVSGDVNALAATSLVGGSSTTITTLSRPGLEGVVGFVGLINGSSFVASCSYGTYNSANGQVAWTGLNAGTLVLEYTGSAVTLLSATGFPDGWTFAVPVVQADGSWKIIVASGAAYGNIISTLTSDKDSIANDGISAATLTATVTDGSGLPVSGVTVTWSTTPGSLSASASSTGSTGQATVTLTDTGDTGACVVTASLDNGSAKSVSVTLTGSSGDDVTLASVTSDKEIITNDGEDQAYLTATVQDSTGNPIQNVAVTWSTDLGTLNHTQQDTDETGQSHAKLSDLGDTGTAVVTATLPDSTYKYVKITVVENDEMLIISGLTSDKGSIVNDGTDAAILTETVTDSTGEVASGVTVNWSTTLGNLNVSSSITDSNGMATCQLTDSGDTGEVIVTAVLDNSNAQSVNIRLRGKAIMRCSTGAPTCVGDFTLVKPTNKVAVYGSARDVIALSVTGDARFLENDSKTILLKLDYVGYGLAEVYDTVEETIYVALDDQHIKSMDFYSVSTPLGMILNSNTPADNRTPCSYYWLGDAQSIYITLTGSAHFADGSQKTTVSVIEEKAATVDFYDGTTETIVINAKSNQGQYESENLEFISVF